MKKDLVKYIFSLFAVCIGLLSNDITAQQTTASGNSDNLNLAPTRKYKKARALQSSTAKKMAKVYEALEEVDEKGEPAPDMETVVSILTELKNNRDELKSYDRSVMWNAWAYVYFSDGDYSKALSAYSNLINEPDVTIGLRVGALLSMGQIHLVQERYSQGIAYILQWMKEVETVTAQSWALLGQAYFSTEDYRKSLSSMEKAISLAEEEGYKPRENWYVIMAANINELKSEIGEKESLLRQIDIYEILVNLYPKKTYFIQLGGSYGQLGRERDYMITLKAAHAKDFLDKESEYLALAQLLLLNKNPYWAAEVLVSGQKRWLQLLMKKQKKKKLYQLLRIQKKT